MADQDPSHREEDQAFPVDESLIDAMLALSPEERLRQNDRMVHTILQLRQGLTQKAPADGRQG
jgi:hypothetical protein